MPSYPCGGFIGSILSHARGRRRFNEGKRLEIRITLPVLVVQTMNPTSLIVASGSRHDSGTLLQPGQSCRICKEPFCFFVSIDPLIYCSALKGTRPGPCAPSSKSCRVLRQSRLCGPTGVRKIRLRDFDQNGLGWQIVVWGQMSGTASLKFRIRPGRGTCLT